ncbi:hypothetical protein TNCV_1645071 [Trichonephila clavipes]|nr:hypothetical protein TNCV_1645071 [Trichonephila clavipes]
MRVFRVFSLTVGASGYTFTCIHCNRLPCTDSDCADFELYSRPLEWLFLDVLFGCRCIAFPETGVRNDTTRRAPDTKFYFYFQGRDLLSSSQVDKREKTMNDRLCNSHIVPLLYSLRYHGLPLHI